MRKNIMDRSQNRPAAAKVEPARRNTRRSHGAQAIPPAQQVRQRLRQPRQGSHRRPEASPRLERGQAPEEQDLRRRRAAEEKAPPRGEGLANLLSAPPAQERAADGLALALRGAHGRSLREIRSGPPH